MKENWTYKKFGEAFNLLMGKTPSRDNVNYWGGENIWVSIADLKGKYIEETKEHITDTAVTESGISKIPQGTAIMSFKLTIGKAAITKCDLFTNEAIMSFVPKEENTIDADYLYYYLKSCKWAGANKAVMGQTLNKKTIAENIFAYPPLSEQHRIVSELDLLQSIIDKQQAQLKELDTLAQAVFYDMFGDPVENEKGWEVKRLGEVCVSITDGDHMPPPKVDEGIPFLTISDIDKDTRKLNFENTFHVPLEYYNSLKNDRKAQVGDLLYTVTGSYGIPVIVDSDRCFCFQRHIALLRPNKNTLDIRFLCYWVLCKSVKAMADNVATGIAQKTVGLGSIRKFVIILPPLTLQQEFAEKIEKIERQKAAISQSIAETQKLFDYTMDKYFN